MSLVRKSLSPEALTYDSDLDGAIVTATGRLIKPLDASPDDFNIYDIAHALANMCRFTGHTRRFYSVAEHSVLAANLASEWAARELPLSHTFEAWEGAVRSYGLTGLLHDASEAYLADVARPIKSQDGIGELYRQAEDRVMKLLADRFEDMIWPFPVAIEEIDDKLLRTEQRALMPHTILEEGDSYGLVPECWSPDRAREEFLRTYNELIIDDTRR